MAGRLKHVALVMRLNKRFDRKVIEGVTRFVPESVRTGEPVEVFNDF